MKLYKSKKAKNPDTSIRIAKKKDGTPFGIIGTVKDLLEEKILLECDAKPHIAALVKPDGTARFYRDIDTLKEIVRNMEI